MDKYKYQIIALVIAILIGTVAGYLLSSNNSDKEIKKLTEQHAKELKEEVSGYKQKIHTLDLKIQELELQAKFDSAKISNLQYSIKKDGVETDLRRKQAAKFTHNEKVDFLLNRYKH